ncbi:MAG: NADH-quinone oxidoreductase subunit N [Acidimicrobiales bacterium]
MIPLLAQTDTLGPGDIPDVAWSGLMPLIILSAAAVLLLTVMTVARDRLPAWFPMLWTFAAGIATMVAAIPLWIRVQDDDRGAFSTLASAYGVDGFSVFATMLLGAALALVALLADDYLEREGLARIEFHVLATLSVAGGVIMASANDLIVLFLGLEILSLAVYVMAAMHLRRIESQEAGLKYFVLGALSSAFLLYGIALVYGATGSTNLIAIQAFLAEFILTENALLLAGFALLLVGLGFKVAAVPFHSWQPDVYQGAPTPVVAYMASGVKIAGFAALIRVFVVTFGDYRTDWQPLVYALAIATLLVGSLLAIVQTDVKRMLAYSSISHAGYMLVGIEAATGEGTSAVLFYLAAYTFMVIGSFAVITLVAGPGDSRTAVSDLKGLSRSRPLLAVALTVFLLGQAGVPFTSGFFAKFYVIEAAVDARSFPLAIIAMLSAVIAAYLYLRIMVSAWLDGDDMDDAEVAEARSAMPIPVGAAIVLVVTVAFTVAFGIWPQPIVEMARDAVPALVAGG